MAARITNADVMVCAETSKISSKVTQSQIQPHKSKF
jgi:translation initiation factor 2B subunit (eIF-2B alpha/beta/delta family)